MRGEGSKAVRNFSKNSSDLVAGQFPYLKENYKIQAIRREIHLKIKKHFKKVAREQDMTEF